MLTVMLHCNHEMKVLAIRVTTQSDYCMTCNYSTLHVLCSLYRPYDIDSSVQLVCKYLRAYKNRGDGRRGINRLYTDNSKSYTLSEASVCITF